MDNLQSNGQADTQTAEPDYKQWVRDVINESKMDAILFTTKCPNCGGKVWMSSKPKPCPNCGNVTSIE